MQKFNKYGIQIKIDNYSKWLKEEHKNKSEHDNITGIIKKITKIIKL